MGTSRRVEKNIAIRHIQVSHVFTDSALVCQCSVAGRAVCLDLLVYQTCILMRRTYILSGSLYGNQITALSG